MQSGGNEGFIPAQEIDLDDTHVANRFLWQVTAKLIAYWADQAQRGENDQRLAPKLEQLHMAVIASIGRGRTEHVPREIVDEEFLVAGKMVDVIVARLGHRRAKREAWDPYVERSCEIEVDGLPICHTWPAARNKDSNFKLPGLSPAERKYRLVASRLPIGARNVKPKLQVARRECRGRKPHSAQVHLVVVFTDVCAQAGKDGALVESGFEALMNSGYDWLRLYYRLRLARSARDNSVDESARFRPSPPIRDQDFYALCRHVSPPT